MNSIYRNNFTNYEFKGKQVEKKPGEEEKKREEAENEMGVKTQTLSPLSEKVTANALDIMANYFKSELEIMDSETPDPRSGGGVHDPVPPPEPTGPHSVLADYLDPRYENEPWYDTLANKFQHSFEKLQYGVTCYHAGSVQLEDLQNVAHDLREIVDMLDRQGFPDCNGLLVQVRLYINAVGLGGQIIL